MCHTWRQFSSFRFILDSLHGETLACPHPAEQFSPEFWRYFSVNFLAVSSSSYFFKKSFNQLLLLPNFRLKVANGHHFGFTAIDLIHDARDLWTHLRTDGIKAMSRGFSGGKQVTNFSNTRNRGRVCLFLITENKQLFILKTIMVNYGWKWSFLLFLDSAATVDVLTANNNDVNFVETQTVHFAWPLNHRFVFGKFYYIDTSVLLENLTLVKFITTTSGTRLVYFP